MAKKHYRIKLADALSAHERALTLGGRPGVLDLGLIESALNRPFSGYYPKINQKTAALVQSLAGNHGFVDGNKRTTMILIEVFLQRSGYELTSLQGEVLQNELENLILESVQGKSFDDVAAWFEARLQRHP